MRLLSLLLISISLLTACTSSDDPKALFDNGEYKKAYQQWHLLAEKNDLNAQNYIGIHHYLGLGVKRDLKFAKQWFEKAATGGFADAQYNLGAMYENGEFVKQDYLTAYMWFYVANQNGNKHSMRRMLALAEGRKLFPNQINRAVELAKDHLK